MPKIATDSNEPHAPPGSSTTSSLLLVEAIPKGSSLSTEEGRFRALAVPDKPCVLHDEGNGDGPELVPLDSLPVGRVGSAGSSPAEANDLDIFDGGAFAMFEPARTASGERLLMITPPGSPIRLNGLSAPLIAPLSIGDQVDLGPSNVVHVSRIQRTEPVGVPEDLVGKPCSLCLAELASDTRVVVCDGCGSARHMEADDVAADERLECASLGSACPECGTELPTSDGYAYWPEG